MWNPYEYMKSTVKKGFDTATHWQYLMISLISMFDWQGLPDTIRPDLLETLWITQGTVGVTDFGLELYTGTGGYCGDYKNFLNTEYIVTNPGIGDKTFKVGSGGVVGWNNCMRMPDIQLMQYASILTEIDVSERCNVLYSRLLPIPRVHDTTEQTAIQDIIKKMLTGEFAAVISDNVQDSLFGDPQHPDSRFFDLSHVADIDKLQYLNQYRDNIIKRWYQIYGQGMQTTSKLAQQTTDELHGSDAVSMIIPLDRLKYRKKFADELNKMYGTSVSVEFSEAYKDSYQEMQELYSTGDKEPDKGGTDDDSSSAED